MQVQIILPEESGDVPNIYLEGMKGYPNPHCKPVLSDRIAQFKLPLADFYECGVTRVVNKLTVNSPLECFSTNSSFLHMSWKSNEQISIFRDEKCSIIK